jgi:hypothetical protein
MEGFCRVESWTQKSPWRIDARCLSWICAGILQQACVNLSITVQLIARTALCRPPVSQLHQERCSVSALAVATRHQLTRLFRRRSYSKCRFVGSRWVRGPTKGTRGEYPAFFYKRGVLNLGCD